ncbi:MAG: plasmid transfer protein [Pseudosphingobacterium sp.]|nr:plasmid transfer protein [Pseudosphingobacterium sp.]
MNTLILQVNHVDVPDSFKETHRFLQGDGIYDENILYFLRGMRKLIMSYCEVFTTDAQALSAIFMLIFFAVKTYEMMSGDKKLEVMPLLRPFGLVMVILWWQTFTKVVAYPAQVIEERSATIFQANLGANDDLRLQRAALIYQVANNLMTIQAETEVAEKEAENMAKGPLETVTSAVREGFAKIWNPIVEMRNRMQVNFQLFVTSMIEKLALWILRICVYIIFIVQVIYSTVLVILGPFAVALSILPAFRDSFTTWVARFISVSLYSGIAYLVMFVGSLFQQFALETEINRYQQLVDTSGDQLEKLAWFTGNGLLSFGIVFIVFIISGLTMLTVPSISTWIVSTSGISSAASTMGRNASSMLATASKILAKKPPVKK